jgi:hypothetical protein|tara:strand:- start:216 stop:605 length:390 start_codon:yes stop_codon:yes gene_type:complete
MKYALINPRGRILRTSEEAFKKLNLLQRKVVGITDEQAEQFEASTEPMFLIEGEILSLKAKRWAKDLEGVKASLRPERNRLLSASDWTQLKDNNLSKNSLSAWTKYRKKLRDLTDNIDENGEVTFPNAP